MSRRHDSALSVAVQRLGISLAALALLAQMALGMLVPRESQDTVAALFPWLNVICHADGARPSAQPGKHVPPLPGWMVCPFTLAASLPMPHLAAPPVTPQPAAVWVAWRPLPPPARAPPSREPNSAQPRGPPILI